MNKGHRFAVNGGYVEAAMEDVHGSLIQTAGTNVVTSTLDISTLPSDRGVYELRGGVLSAANIDGPVSMFGGAFSVLSMDGVLVNDGGVISPGHSIGTMSLGGLVQKSGTLQIELGALADFDKVLIGNSPELGGVLDLRSMSGYRPREGESFPLITVTCSEPSEAHYLGGFQAVTSNITRGLPAGQAFSGGADAREYRVTFLGSTNGDANGDHKVNGGDLALIGGNWMKGATRPFPGDATHDDRVDGGDLALMGGGWMQTGKSWADGDFNGNGKVDGGDLALIGGNWMKRLMAWPDTDFTGEGTVDGADLALMGGNWMWALPPAPPQGAPLPEPSALCLVALGGLVLLRHRVGTARRTVGR